MHLLVIERYQVAILNAVLVTRLLMDLLRQSVLPIQGSKPTRLELLRLRVHITARYILQFVILPLQVANDLVQALVLVEDLRLLETLLLHSPQVLLDLIRLVVDHCLQLLVLELQVLVHLIESVLVLLALG